MLVIYILLGIISLVVLVPVLLIVFVLIFKKDLIMDMARTMQSGMEGAMNGRGERKNRKQQQSGMSKSEAIQILGVDENASHAEINKAYHKLMKSVHPDKGGSEFLAQQINRARDLLLNKKK